MSELLVGLSADAAETERSGRSAWLRSPKTVVGLSILGVFVLMAIFGPLVAPYDPTATSATALLSSPSTAHLLGTTTEGQDVLSQLLVGARDTMLVGILAAVIGETLAIVIGITAGYLGGLVDEGLSSLTNIFLVIPVLPLEIVLSSYLTNAGWIAITLIISLTAWPFGARALRAQTLSIRRRDYVAAAKVAGDSTRRIVLFEILPNETAIIVTGFLFQILFAIIVQTGLAFLGIGNIETQSWGSMLYFAQNSDAFLNGAWWWYVPPGLCVALVGTALALTNLGIDEIINPKLRTQRRPSRRARRRHPLQARPGSPRQGGALS
jgi:peptide/nickel transport system permease protein